MREKKDQPHSNSIENIPPVYGSCSIHRSKIAYFKYEFA